VANETGYDAHGQHECTANGRHRPEPLGEPFDDPWANDAPNRAVRNEQGSVKQLVARHLNRVDERKHNQKQRQVKQPKKRYDNPSKQVRTTTAQIHQMVNTERNEAIDSYEYDRENQPAAKGLGILLWVHVA
jgi:hypothetical protein